MTQMPPPQGVPYQSGTQPINQQAQTNVAAIISLICGIVGCLGITALAAIVSGIIGIVQAKTLKTGKGMAIAGIVLAVLWVVGEVGFVALIGYGVKNGGSAFLDAIGGAAVKPAMTVTLDDLADGNTSAAQKYLPGLSQEELDGLAAQLKPMGHVKTIDFPTFHSNFTNGQSTHTFSGTVTFENGTKTIDGSASSSGGNVTMDRIDIK